MLIVERAGDGKQLHEEEEGRVSAAAQKAMRKRADLVCPVSRDLLLSRALVIQLRSSAPAESAAQGDSKAEEREKERRNEKRNEKRGSI